VASITFFILFRWCATVHKYSDIFLLVHSSNCIISQLRSPYQKGSTRELKRGRRIRGRTKEHTVLVTIIQELQTCTYLVMVSTERVLLNDVNIALIPLL
jgi:hypothetical protein